MGLYWPLHLKELLVESWKASVHSPSKIDGMFLLTKSIQQTTQDFSQNDISELLFINSPFCVKNIYSDMVICNSHYPQKDVTGFV